MIDGVFCYCVARLALACSMTSKISDCGQRDDAPSLRGLGSFPNLTCRHRVGSEIARISAASLAFKRGSVRLIHIPFQGLNVPDRLYEGIQNAKRNSF